MPPSAEGGERSAERAAEPPRTVDGARTADDLTLARAAAGGGPDARAAAVELALRHQDAVVAYAAQCTASSRAAALLTAAASAAALRELLTEDGDPAWRPHLLAVVLRTAADWSRDDRRQRLDPALLEWLAGPGTAVEDQEGQAPLARAFQRLPQRVQVCLWHLAVERDSPVTVARLLGTEPGTVLSWALTLQDRLRTAYTQVLDTHAAPPCRPFTRLLIGAAESRLPAADAWTVSGLGTHVAVCPACARALSDLTRLHDPGYGVLLAGELLRWGGPHYFSAKAGRDPGPDQAPEPEGRETGRTRRPRGLRGRVAFTALGACAAALAALLLWMSAPPFSWAGHGSPSRPSAHAVTKGPTHSAAPSPSAAPPSPSPSGVRVKKSRKAKASASVSPPPAVHGLAVPDAALRCDFSASRPTATDACPGRFTGGARAVADRAGSARFDGTGAFVTPHAVIDTRRSFTVSAWVRLTCTSGFQTVAGQDGGHVGGFFLQYAADAGRWRFAMGDRDSVDSDESAVLSRRAPVTGGWQHLTGVFDAGARTVRLYVNGGLQGSEAHAATWPANGPFSIGRGWWDGRPADLFHGGIDDVRVYARALDTSQVKALAGARPNA
ncbi:LamG-like jellyroll fold domain-containing protein [Streptomyces sp. NPDC047028]|uniref:LamG-like jellyroll fold domain-containing protein n=1 Tax=Streptomyces sp. NPDC047028 TaxID=3155793 RepID=UPI00340F6351